MFLKDGKKSREIYEKIIEDVLKKNPIVPMELLSIYKDLIADTCMALQEQLYKQYANEDAMIAETSKFVDAVEKNNGIGSTSGFLILSIPLLIPIEVGACSYLLQSGVLPYHLAKISEYFVDDILSVMSMINEYLNKETQNIFSNITKNSKPYLN